MFPIELCTADAFSAGDIHITPFRTDHTGDSLGLIAEADGKRVIYTSDTRPVASVMKEMSSPDILIAEASGDSSAEEILIKKGHQSGKDAAELAVRLTAKCLILVHLPDSEEERMAILNEASMVFPESEIPEPLEVFRI